MKSTSGSYTGANPMGLFEFMKPAKGSDAEFFSSISKMKPFTVTLAATVDGHTVATAVARRLPMAKGVTRKSLRPGKDGVYADLFLPPRSTTRTIRNW
ncbi:acyl-CoA thioesterase/BAAT N-terminal domain-containing protein [Leekyejoonella antrihumi]|uniref:Acyl-CoA thioester hydrolase/bile acid-CoA amino acid N-acetyltransferase domain-containing protein n=1 Tax=Leekyejoonella antrihumi TaxID=1660198 RepID=A0A563E9M9_9MICO|nr:acyl-CoA thioesterase/BAAT N-terminal domain-containing protein [Leekyejoonella antrihumi]TWP39029.1 hypothetical protein FGL98_01165 [Leekyejoonella antrihumi]